MYSARLGFNSAKSRIRELIKNGHHAEALLTSVFTFEKIIHRTLKQLMVSAGFRNADAKLLLNQLRGFKKQKDIWRCFDPNGASLPTIIGNTQWQEINDAISMRNHLVHGLRVYQLDTCRDMAEKILVVLDLTVDTFKTNYGYDGWANVSVRHKAKLHADPKVKLASV